MHVLDTMVIPMSFFLGIEEGSHPSVTEAETTGVGAALVLQNTRFCHTSHLPETVPVLKSSSLTIRLSSQNTVLYCEFLRLYHSVSSSEAKNKSSPPGTAKRGRPPMQYRLVIGTLDSTYVPGSKRCPSASQPSVSYQRVEMKMSALLFLLMTSLAYKAVGGVTSQCAIRNVDLLFVVDGSSSISTADFTLTKQFVSETVTSMDIGPSASQIGFVQFSSSPTTEFHLNRFSNKADILAKISTIQQQHGGTAIAKVSSVKYLVCNRSG